MLKQIHKSWYFQQQHCDSASISQWWRVVNWLVLMWHTWVQVGSIKTESNVSLRSWRANFMKFSSSIVISRTTACNLMEPPYTSPCVMISLQGFGSSGSSWKRICIHYRFSVRKYKYYHFRILWSLRVLPLRQMSQSGRKVIKAVIKNSKFETDSKNSFSDIIMLNWSLFLFPTVYFFGNILTSKRNATF